MVRPVTLSPVTLRGRRLPYGPARCSFSHSGDFAELRQLGGVRWEHVRLAAFEPLPLVARAQLLGFAPFPRGSAERRGDIAGDGPGAFGLV